MQILTSRRRTVVQELIRQQGRKQGWIARQLGLRDAELSLMIQGKRRCTPEQAGFIAGLLAVPVSTFYRDGEFVIATQTSDEGSR